MKASHVLLCVTVTLSLAGVAMVSCRAIRPPSPTTRPTESQPTTQTTTASAPAPKFVWYTVKRGDTARSIAPRMLTNGKADDITLNNPEITDWRKLSIGDRVRLPIRKLKDQTLAGSPSLPYADDPPPRQIPPEETLKHPYPDMHGNR
ncbi:MAG: hypothetical protein FWE88_08855 [Phycisphaerae bacterium]|nr:hypothetical protein [Phycisphaerae bacterium]